MKIEDCFLCGFFDKVDLKKVAKQFALVGAAMGFFVWVAFFLVELLSKKHLVDGNLIVGFHKIDPTWWVIDLLFVGIIFSAYFVGKLHVVYIKHQKEKEQERQEQVHHLLVYADQLNKGNFDAPVNFDDSSALGCSILQFRDYLAQSRQQEITRNEEEKQHSWVADGLAMFGEILRVNNSNLETLSYSIISKLVKYLDANQGGFFLVEDSDPSDMHFIQTAAFAYDRQRLVSKRVEWNDGLIGACAFEKESIFMTDIPDRYVSITSGLGDANPRCLFIVPLVVDDHVLGVIEIASFKILKPFETRFVENLSQAIASTIKNVKVNSRTAELLDQSRQQAEQLRVQEEEMLHTIEEMNVIQEESARKSVELASFTDSVNNTMVRAEYDISGKLLFANNRFLSKMGYAHLDEIKGKHISSFINKRDKDWFFDIWNRLTKGGEHFEGDMKHVTFSGTDFWSMATYTCVRNQQGEVQKILFMGIDITDLKNRSLELESQVFALNNATVTAEFNPEGMLLNCNSKFSSVLGFHPVELKSMFVRDFFEDSYKTSFSKTWSEVLKGNQQEFQYKFLSKSGDVKWLQGTFTAVYDMYGELSKVVFISNDITSQKLLEIEAKHKTDQLLEQDKQLVQKLEEIKAVKIRNEETLEGAMDAIITINSKEEVELFNRAAANLLGYSNDEVIGRDVRMLLPESLRSLPQGSIVGFLKSDANRFKGMRSEVTAYDRWGGELSLLLTVSESHIGDDSTFTAFIQNISVELF